MRGPNFFILGVQKCGTTTIADLLSAHQDVFVPSIKETYFFNVDSNYEKGLDHYLSEYYSAVRSNHRLIGDATPFYLCSRAAIDRLHDYQGEVNPQKFIVVLRDPVKRAYSAYWHQRRLGNEKLDFESALGAEQERIEHARQQKDRWWRHAYIEVGMYAKQLEYAFSRLGKENFFIATEQDLADLAGLWFRLSQFLGLPDEFPRSVNLHSNRAGMPRFRLLHKAVTGGSWPKRFIQAMVPRELRTRVGRRILNANIRTESPPPMRDATRERLIEVFHADVQQTRSILGQELSHWLT